MSQPNRQMKKHIGLVGAICGSLLLSIPAIAQTNPSTKPSPNSASSEMCSPPNTDATSSPAEGTSSANSNRNTPTTDRASNTNTGSRTTASTSSGNSNRNMQTSDRTTNTDTTSRTTEGSSSANSNRNVPTPTTTGDRTPSVTETLPSGTVEEQPSTRRDPAALREQNNTSAGAEVCAGPNSTDLSPSNGSPNRDKQMRRNNSRAIAPTPEQQQAATAMVRPANGMVNVKLVNQTGANIVYEAIGETTPRNLQGQTSITLQRLDTPSTITFYRADGGLLMVRPQAVAPGVLEVRLAATTDLGMDKNALTVQPTGAVYLN